MTTAGRVTKRGESVTAGGTGSITLTPFRTRDAAGSLFLKQDSTNILSWNEAGAVTVSSALM